VIAKRPHGQQREFLELAQALALHGRIHSIFSSLLYR
jgi:hypothetical protein